MTANTIKPVSILFNFFDEDLDLEHSHLMDDGFECIRVKFLVDQPYYTKNEDGDLIFISQYRKPLTGLITSFINRHVDHFDTGFYEEGAFDPLNYATKVNQELQHILTKYFAVPGKIELFQIQFLGSWEVYIGDRNSASRKRTIEKIRENGGFKDDDDF